MVISDGGAVDHGGVDDLALARPLRLEQRRATTPNASSMPPPPKSPTRLSGGTGASPRRPIGSSAPASEM